MAIYQQPAPQMYQQQGRPYQQRPMQAPPGGQVAGGDRYLPAMPEMLGGQGQGQPLQQVPQSRPVMQPQYAQQPQPRSPRGGSDTYLPAMPEMLQVASQEYKPQRSGMVVRGARPEAPVTPPTRAASQAVEMPSPEQLGLSGAAPKLGAPIRTIDWNTARERLEALGATQYRLEKLGVKQFRFVCVVPHPKNAERQQQFEITASTEGEAMMATLESVQKWMETQP
jgi:hypothetical protein